MELTMYDKLLQLPLFQGMSKFDFTDILEKVKIHFNKYEPGSCLVRQDTPCNQLIFVLDGEVQIESNDKTHKYTLWENFKSPNVIEPYSLFGMRPYFTASYTAVTEVNTLNIDKSYILNELCRYEVFNLNYMNRYLKAFALLGRQVCVRNYPGRCSGLGASALSGRAACRLSWARSF